MSTPNPNDAISSLRIDTSTGSSVTTVPSNYTWDATTDSFVITDSKGAVIMYPTTTSTGLTSSDWSIVDVEGEKAKKEVRELRKDVRDAKQIIGGLRATVETLREEVALLAQNKPYTALFVISAPDGPETEFHERVNKAFANFKGDIEIAYEEGGVVVALAVPRGRAQFSPSGLQSYLQKSVLPRIGDVALDGFETNAAPIIDV